MLGSQSVMVNGAPMADARQPRRILRRVIAERRRGGHIYALPHHLNLRAYAVPVGQASPLVTPLRILQGFYLHGRTDQSGTKWAISLTRF